MNGDNKPDVVVTNNGASTLTVFLNKGDGTGGLNVGGSPLSRPADPAAWLSATLMGIKRQDLIVGHSSDAKVGVLLGNGDGTFKARIDTPALFTGLGSVSLGDVNGDAKMDVCVSSSTSNNGIILLGNGDGGFQSAGPTSEF